MVVGSPATVRDRLKDIALHTGLGTLIPNFSVGNVPHHLTRKSVELFAREVMPALRDVNVDEPPAVSHQSPDERPPVATQQPSAVAER